LPDRLHLKITICSTPVHFCLVSYGSSSDYFLLAAMEMLGILAVTTFTTAVAVCRVYL